MNNETMLLNAAKAMGLKFHSYVDNPMIGCGINIGDCETPIWNPLESSADCAEMEDALDIAHHRYGSPVVHIRAYSMDLLSSNLLAFSEFGNKGAARRYASTMVAAMIGSKM